MTTSGKQVILIRHSEPHPLEAMGIPLQDDEILMPEGVELAKRVGQALKSMKIDFDAVYSSPVPRAEKTARTIHDVMQASTPHPINTGTSELFAEKRNTGERVESVLGFLFETHNSIVVVTHDQILLDLEQRFNVASNTPPGENPKVGYCSGLIIPWNDQTGTFDRANVRRFESKPLTP